MERERYIVIVEVSHSNFQFVVGFEIIDGANAQGASQRQLGRNQDRWDAAPTLLPKGKEPFNGYPDVRKHSQVQ